MFAYNEEGELVNVDSEEAAVSRHALMTLASERYELAPAAVGQLRELLGEADPEITEAQARRRVQRALAAAGFSGLPFDVAVEALDSSWAAKINVQ